MQIEMLTTNDGWNVIGTDDTNTAKVALKRVVKCYPFTSYRIRSADGRILAAYAPKVSA